MIKLARAEQLIVALDYCLSCRGTCPTCVLSRSERLSTGPAMTVEAAVGALSAIAPMYPDIGHLALGIGRGNNLAMPEETVADFVAIARAVDGLFRFEDGVLEISTSLVGKIEPQIDRARRILRTFRQARTRLDPRFVVVANTALASAPYWRNLDKFIRSMEDERGGRADGTGDILQLNVATGSLPEPEMLCATLSEYRFPVNVTWAPAFDPGARTEEGLEALTTWIGRFYRASRDTGLDANIVTRTAGALSVGAETLPDAIATVRGSAANVVYVAPNGSFHEGFTSVLAEMDPVRYDPASVTSEGSAAVVRDPTAEVLQLARNRACRLCPRLPLCVVAGAYRVGLIALRAHPKGTKVCPSGMRKAFDEAMGFAA